MKKKNENDYLSLKIVILIIVAFIVGLSEIFIEKNIVKGVFFMIFGVVVLSLVIAEKRNSKARNIQPVKEPVNEENEGAEWTPAFFHRGGAVGTEAEMNYLLSLSSQNRWRAGCSLLDLSDEEIHELYCRTIEDLDCKEEAEKFCRNWCMTYK